MYLILLTWTFGASFLKYQYSPPILYQSEGPFVQRSHPHLFDTTFTAVLQDCITAGVQAGCRLQVHHQSSFYSYPQLTSLTISLNTLWWQTILHKTGTKTVANSVFDSAQIADLWVADLRVAEARCRDAVYRDQADGSRAVRSSQPSPALRPAHSQDSGQHVSVP